MRRIALKKPLTCLLALALAGASFPASALAQVVNAGGNGANPAALGLAGASAQQTGFASDVNRLLELVPGLVGDGTGNLPTPSQLVSILAPQAGQDAPEGFLEARAAGLSVLGALSRPETALPRLAEDLRRLDGGEAPGEGARAAEGLERLARHYNGGRTALLLERAIRTRRLLLPSYGTEVFDGGLASAVRHPETSVVRDQPFQLLGNESLPRNRLMPPTRRWIPRAEEQSARDLLYNYAPSPVETASYEGIAAPALRVQARQQSLARLTGLYLRLGADAVASPGLWLRLAELRDRVERGDHNGALRSLLAVSQEGRALGPTASEHIDESLAPIYSLQSRVKAMADHVKLASDGAERTSIHYWIPAELKSEQRRRGWVEPALGEPVADIVIVGGGPGGLAAAYYASQAHPKEGPGLRTVLMEGGYVGQAFSDGGAPGVHWLRTNRWVTNLAVGGVVPMAHVAAVSMARVSERLGFKRKAHAGLKDIEERTGDRFIGRSHIERRQALPHETWLRWTPVGWLSWLFFHALRERVHPVTRSETFQYFAHVAAHIADSPNAMVVEQAPVTRVTRLPNGLWDIETAAGHRQLARRLVIGTGIVGTDAEFAKVPREFEALAGANEGRYVVLENFKALDSKAAELHEMFLDHTARKSLGINPNPGKQLMMVDTVLRTPESQRYLKSLRPGTRVAVVGSGESAAKGAMDILIQNPGLKVSIFLKAEMEPAQVQIPETFMTPELAKRGVFDPAYGKHSVDQWKRVFGTPITPQTMLDLLRAQKEGRLQIYEMGKYFTEDVVSLTSRVEAPFQHRHGDALGETVTGVEVKDPQVVANLRRQAETWKRDYGLEVDLGKTMPDGGLRLPEIDGAVVFATGFDRKRMRRLHPLMQQLLDQGRIELTEGNEQGFYNGEIRLNPQDRLTSAKDDTLGFAGFVNHDGSAADSAIPGMGVRAYYLALHMKKSLRREAWEFVSRRLLRAYQRTTGAEPDPSDPRDEAMTQATVVRAMQMPDYRKPPRTQKTYRKGPAANPVTLDPSLLLLDVLPWPIVATTFQALVLGTVDWSISLLPIPATLIPGLGRFLPYYRQKFRRPIDVIVRSLDTQRALGGGILMSGIERLVTDRAAQLTKRSSTPLDRLHIGEYLQALAGLLASFRIWKPGAVKTFEPPQDGRAP